MPREFSNSFSDIPSSVEDVLDDSATFQPAALAAVKALARSKPWTGTDAERLEKFNACAAALASAYSAPAWTIIIGEPGQFDAQQHVFPLEKLSVVSFLHAMALIRGCNRFSAYRWSINIFRRCFPKSYARCRHDGPNLIVAE